MDQIPGYLQDKMFADLIRLLTTLMQAFISVHANVEIRNDFRRREGTSTFVAEEDREGFETFRRMMRSVPSPEHVPEAASTIPVSPEGSVPSPEHVPEAASTIPVSPEDDPVPTPPPESPQLERNRSRSRHRRT